MSTERIERIRADEVRPGDRIKPPEGGAFYEMTVVEHKPGIYGEDSDKVELGTGWGSVTLEPGEMVERENWQVGEAEREIDASLRSRLDTIHNLSRLANPGVDLDEWSNDDLLALDIGYGQSGPLERKEIQEQAEERLNEFPLAVEATTVFEVVIGTGGPDDRLLFECSHAERLPASGYYVYEINRVLYRYSWTGSAERELTGEDRETAEELARRVVPELVD